MPRLRILVTNDDGWDAPGLVALKRAAAEFGDVVVVAPADPHSYVGHRVTVERALTLKETAPGEFSLSGTPADCVRVAVTALLPDLDWVLSGINRGGNLGADLFTSGTVAAVRESALLGKPGIAISQYIRRGREVDWERATELVKPVLAQLLSESAPEKVYWNVNLPHRDDPQTAVIVDCDPDNAPLDVRFRRQADQFFYSGTYQARPRTPGRDIDQCFAGNITISRLRL